MPSPADIAAAKRRGYNPYAIAQAMVNKGQIPASKREHTVYKVTRSVLKRKRRT